MNNKIRKMCEAHFGHLKTGYSRNGLLKEHQKLGLISKFWGAYNPILKKAYDGEWSEFKNNPQNFLENNKKFKTQLQAFILS